MRHSGIAGNEDAWHLRADLPDVLQLDIDRGLGANPSVGGRQFRRVGCFRGRRQCARYGQWEFSNTRIACGREAGAFAPELGALSSHEFYPPLP